MSVNAGEIYVDIAARIDRLEQGLTAAKGVAVKGGGEVGNKFGYEFGAKFGEQAKGIMGQLAGPMIAATLAKSAAAVLRSEKALPEAILDGLKTIPFVGAFVDLGSAIYDATFGAADKAADDLAKKAASAREMILKVRGEEAKRQIEGGKAANALENERRTLQAANDILVVKSKQGEIAAANAEYEAKVAAQQLALELKMAEDVTDVEFNAFLQLNREKRRQFELERDAAIRAIEERAAKEAEEKAKAAAEEEKIRKSREAAAEADVESARARRDEAKALADGDAKRAQELAKQREEIARNAALEKALRDAKSEDEKRAIRERFALEEETGALQRKMADAAARAATATGSASTALGQFTFDAYPKERQRTLDEMIAKNTERMAQSMGNFGVF